MKTSQTNLDEVAILQYAFKNKILQANCIKIAAKAEASEAFWPDDIVFEHALEDVNTIGIAFRIMSHTLKVIEKTGRFRRSETNKSNGRTIFQYRTSNPSLLKAFLRKNGVKLLQKIHPELDLRYE